MPLVRFTASAIDASSSGDAVFLRLFVMRPTASFIAATMTCRGATLALRSPLAKPASIPPNASASASPSGLSFVSSAILSSIGLRTSDGRPRGSGVHRMLRPALVALLPLTLAACEADPIAARATLTELGFHGIALSRAPLTGRPCAWGEPFAVRYRAVTEDGRIVAGTLCSVDEATEDARLLPDAEGRR